MIGYLWRHSHFLLAAVSAVFLLMASITGAILAFEPITQSIQNYKPVNLEGVFLMECVKVLKDTYPEVLDLEISPQGFVKASVFTEQGKSEQIFVHPKTGEKLGDVIPQSPLFSFVTNLHRSLFLKGIGRAFIGIVSLLLCFIAITGVLLLAQRQGGIRKLFTKVREKKIEQRYHVFVSRWFLLPILLIATTGTWLSAEKFALLPETDLQHIPNSRTPIGENHFFEKLPLSEVRSMMFPFSEDPEEYFEITLQDREVHVHQHTGAVLSEVTFPFVKLASLWSLKWHTGQGSNIWSIILFLTALGLLFLIYSGLVMSIIRLRKPKSAPKGSNHSDAEYVILVGSETRNTYTFAKAFYKALINNSKTVHIADLNTYTSYPRASHLIIFTATYGDGVAPSNARNFQERFHKIVPSNKMWYSVIGFGSLNYPKYCQYAIAVDTLLQLHKDFKPLLPLTKVSGQSENAFMGWIQDWNTITGMDLQISPFSRKTNKSVPFTIIEHTGLNVDNTALLLLRPKRRLKFKSGDLLNIVPPNETLPRKYSVAKIGNDILLSVKWHPKGKCSTYLCLVKIDEIINATIEENSAFHFPKKAPLVWMVANGTGIAPFLGMLNEGKRISKKLTWGGRERESFNNYQKYINEASNYNRSQILDISLAFSQVNSKKYVQNVLLEMKKEVAYSLDKGGVFMLCGSLKMQQSVLQTLNEITTEVLERPLTDFENKGQLKMDCY